MFFFSLGIFGGWGSVGEEYQDFWNRIHFLDFSASLGLAFHPTGTGGQVEQRTSKPFGLHQFGSSVGLVDSNDPKTCEERQMDGDIFMGYLYIYSCCFIKYGKHSP